MSSPLALPVLGFPCTEYVVLPAVALSMLSGCEERTVPTALRGHTLPWSHSSFSPYTHTTNPRNQHTTHTSWLRPLNGRTRIYHIIIRTFGRAQNGNSTPLVRAKAQKKGEVREDLRAPPAAPGEALVSAQPPDVDAFRLIRGTAVTTRPSQYRCCN